TTVEETETPEGKLKHTTVTKRVIKKRVGPKLETTQITTEQTDDEQPIISIHKTEELIDDTTTPLEDLHKPEEAKTVEEAPEKVEVTQVRTETGDVKTIKTTKRVIKKKRGPKEEITEITTIEKDDEAPVTTVTVKEESAPEETKPVEIVELPEETTVEETETPEGPKLETTHITTEQTDDEQPIISVHKTEELIDDTTTPLTDLHKPDKAKPVEEAPEKVEVTQVRTQTGDVKTVKTTKRVIKNKKGPKEKVTEITTIEKDDEEPVTTVTVKEESAPEDSKPVEIVELPEETTVDENETPEGKPKHTTVKKRIIKKRVGPKLETTHITTEQTDDEQPIISVHKTEELIDDTTTPLTDLHKPDKAKPVEEAPEKVEVTQVRTQTGDVKTVKTTKRVIKNKKGPKEDKPDKAKPVEEAPEKVEVAQVRTQTGDVKTVKTTKRVIKNKKGPKEEVTEITTIEKDDEEPVTTVTVKEESAPEDSKPVEIVELPEETTVEETETPEGKLKQTTVTKRIIKKRVGPKLETTQITTEQTDDEQPIISVHKTEELIDDTTTPLTDLHKPDKAKPVEEAPEKVEVTQVRTQTGDVKTIKTTKRVIKNKKGPKGEVTEITTIEKDDEEPVTTVTVKEESTPEDSKSVEIVELPEETTVEETETPEGKLKHTTVTKRVIKKRVGPKLETTQITTEQTDDEQPIISVHKTEELIDDTTTPLTDLHKPDKAKPVEEAPEQVEVTQVRTQTGGVKTVKTTKRVIKNKKGPKEEVTEITTIEKDDEEPVTTVTVKEESAPEDSKPVEIVELPEETTVEETETPEGKLKQTTVTKRIIKKRVGPKLETTQITTEQTDDEQPIISVHKTEELIDDTTTPLTDLHKPDKAKPVEEAPEKVEVTQVRTQTGDVKTVKTTKRVIKNKKGPKGEVTEITTIEKDDEEPVTTVTVKEESTPEDSKSVEIVELPEETTVEETETPEGKLKHTTVTKRVIKKRVGPKLETTQITTEQTDDEQPIISVHKTEELIDDTTTPLTDLHKPDKAKPVEEAPVKVEVTQVRTQTGGVKTVKTTKRVIKNKKGPKGEVTEITTIEKDDEEPFTTVTVKEESAPEDTKPVEIVELPEETTVEETETPEGKLKHTTVTKRVIKKRVGPKLETTQITTEQTDDEQPIISVHKTEELIDDTTTPLTDLHKPDKAKPVEEAPEKVEVTQVRTQTGDVKTVKTTKRVIKNKKGPKEEVTEITTIEKDGEEPVTTVTVQEESAPEDGKPVEIVELPEETTVEETETPEDLHKPEEAKPVEEAPEKVEVTQVRTETGDVKTIKTTKRVIKKKRGPKEEITEITTIEKDDEEPVTTVTVKEESAPEDSKPVEIIELPEETTVEENETPEGKLKHTTVTKRIIKKRVGPKLETTHITTEQTDDEQPIISVHKTEELIDDTTTPLTDLHKPDKAKPVEEAPEKVEVTQVRTQTGDVKTVKTTKRVIKNKKGPKGEVTEITTIEKDDEEPFTTVTVKEESAPEDTKPVEIVELPEETTVEETETPEGKLKHTTVTKRVIKKRVGPKLETTQITTEQTDDEQPIISVHKTEELIDDTTTPLTDLHKPDKAKLVEEAPEKVEVTQVRTQTGDVKTVKTTKRVIKNKKGPKEEVTEITTIEKDDEEPVTTVTVKEESAPEDGKPVEIVELPEETTVEETETPEDTVVEPKKDFKEEERRPMVADIPHEDATPKKTDKRKAKLTPIKIERKELDIGKPQHAASIEGPQFSTLKLKKTLVKPKEETKVVKLPKFQLKSRIKYIIDWPPPITTPVISFLGSVRQNGILSRNVKEAAKIKKRVYKAPILPEIEKIELEKPLFGYEDIVDAKKQTESENQDDELKPEDNFENEEIKEEEPEQFTISPRRPSIKKTDEIVGEVTIKKKLKPVRKSSVTLPEVTEPETVTFRPKSVKTKEDVEQEFNIHLDSYAEEEISMTSKVKLKPQRQPTFSEEADETSIKFYEDNENEDTVPEIIEVIESDDDKEGDVNVSMPLKKLKQPSLEKSEVFDSSVTVSRPKSNEEILEIDQTIDLVLHKKPKYRIDDEEEITFDLKPQVEVLSNEDVSSKITIKQKPKVTVAEAATETSIQLIQEIEDDRQAEEIVLSEAESEQNVEMVIKRKPKKPVYEVSEVEELSVELKPKKVKDIAFEEEQLTISTKRKPKKPSQIQEADASMSIAREQEFPESPLDVRSGDTVFAVYSYVAETDEAISLVEGERLYILETTNQDWWFVRKHLTEEKGWVPAQYLMDEANYTLYLQKKLNEKIDKLPVFEKPTSEEQAVAPIFTEKLRPKHTPDGSTVQFECQVEGYPRPQITWFRQTAIIKPSQDFQMYYDDDNVATLIIREVFPEDAGTFTCVAKNAAGFASSTTELIVEAPLSDHGSEMTILSRKSLSRESSLADILEGIPPTFSKRPKAQYVDEGSQIFLECRLVAIPEPDIAWFFKGEEIMPDENISIATESDMHMYCSVLKISNVKKFQEGTYTVLAVNREGEASLPIVLKIKTGQKEQPQVIEPLKNITIREGESVVLSTQVVGNPQPTVNWYKNNKPVKSLTTKSDGDTHTVTIIKPRKGKDDGVYTLKAVNSEGTAETSAVITIEEPTEENAEPPLFINRFQEITVKEKGTIKLMAKVTGNPVPSITWYRNNKIITPSETVTQHFDGENIQLIISNVDSEIDSGDYKCVASNTAGKASHGARVTIDVDKVTFIKLLNKFYEIEEGKTIVLECQTSHTVSTKWFHNNKEISGMDHREIIQEGRVHKLRIKKTKLTDVGDIKCVVKDQETNTQLIVHETVPEFVRKLQDFEVKERDVAILEVEVNSETADVYWEKDGDRIKPKKNKYELEKRGSIRKLYIRNTSVHDEGEYTCILRDDACTAEVTVVELPPEIISRLQDQKVSKGTKATFEIELTKGDALVQWFKNGSEIQFSNHIQLTIDGKKQKLKIYDCQLDDAGEYACEVGNDRCTAKLTVEEPSIDFTLRLPEIVVVPANADAYLTVKIPDETLDVTWFKKKTVIEDTEKFTLISDGVKRTLIIRKCTEEDQTEYSCLLLDAKCSTKLKVEEIEYPPRIISYDDEYRIKRGGDVTLLVQYEAVPQPNDEWVVNSKIIKKSKHTKPSIDSKSASLTIKKVEHTDAGTYKLRLENNCGVTDIDINLIVLDIPSAPGKPNVLETDNNSANVCWDEPTNKGNSEILCYIVEYQEINTVEWISIENVIKSQTTIKNLKTNSLYRFRVFAVNEVGVSESSEITDYVKIQKITARQPPSVEKPLKDVFAAPDEDIELTCIFGGVPQPKVTWYKDGKKLKTAKATYVNRVATLIVTTIESAEGEYKCIATNELGEVETSCKLEVQMKPIIQVAEDEINQKHKVGEQWSVTATIKGIPKPNIMWFKNTMKLTKSNEINITIHEYITTIVISELKRTHSGKYIIEAQNKAGVTSFELSLNVFDKPSKPEGPVVMREISKESVTIEWKPPLDDGGIELTKYAIEKHEPETNQWVKVADVDKDIESYCIQRLNENCEYMFRVIAQNPVGFSEALESEPIVIKTALDVPSPPLGPLGLYGIDNESVTITWYPSEKNGGSPILDYSVEIKQEGKKWKHVATVTETTAKIKKLTMNTTYQFRICARNEIGTSLPYVSDEKITIGKSLSPPSRPLNFLLREITSRSVTLQWAAPESDGGSVITNYIIEYKTVKGKSWTKAITVGGTVYEHCIENIKEKEEFIFRISAENAVGISLPTESKSVKLEKHATVPSPPTAPLEIRMVGNNIVMTSWGTPEWDGGAPLLGYNIAIRDVTKTMWMEVGKVDAQTLKFNIRDLSENHTYMIRIFARNEIGLSEPLESDEPFKVIPSEDSHADEEPGEQTEATEPTSFSTQTTTSWLREHNMDADIRSYARGSLLRRDEYFFRIWHYAKQLFK
ncbi:hypothetical protein O3G_MSEX010918, partial [Manduca sexta]